MAWIEDRPETYDETLIWDEENGEWTDADGSAGSRYQTYLVAVGQDDDGNGVIYYG